MNRFIGTMEGNSALDESLPQDDPQVMALVCELDACLERGEDSSELLATSVVGLSPDQHRQLAKAEEALLLINGVRRNLGVLQSLGHELAADSQAIADDSTIAGARSRTVPFVELPRNLGRFEILDVLGQGGFNRVFLARDPQLDRLVALKVPRPEALADDASRRRFQREALAAAVFSHPAIVPIFESGSFGPINYIAFGYCEGETLGKWFADQGASIDERQAARIVARLAEAVEHAHERGVIHRDLKPSNVLIESGAQDNAIDERLRITDFGLAKLEVTNDESLTVDGAIVGTPAYMSPEQARGIADVKPATDVFTLGTMLYELLTGQLPFRRDSHLATLRAIESETPKPPRSIRPKISRDMEAICLKCLQKEPDLRYASAHDLAADLRSFLEGRPIQARHATPLEQLAAFRRRNPALATVLALFAASVFVGLAATTWQWRRSLVNFRESESQRMRAEESVEMTQHAIDRMFNALSNDVSVPRPLRNKLMGDAVELQEALIKNEPGNSNIQIQTARAHYRLANLLRVIGNREQALVEIDRGLEITHALSDDAATEVREELLFELNRLRQLTAVTLRPDDDGKGKKRGPGALTRVEAIREAVRLRNDGQVLMQQGKLAEGKMRFVKSLEVLDENNIGDNSGLVHRSFGLFQLARVQEKLGELADAEGSIHRATDLALEAVETISPRREELAEHAAKALNMSGDIQLCLGNNEEALELWNQGMSRYEAELELFPESANLLWGYLYGGTGIAKGLEATDQAGKALELLRRLAQQVDEIDPDQLEQSFLGARASFVYGDLCAAARKSGHWDEAIHAGERAVEIIDRCQDVQANLYGVQRGQAYSRHAEALATAGRLEEALAQAQTAWEFAQDSLDQSPGDVGVLSVYLDCVNALAVIHCQLDDPQSAIKSLKEVRDAHIESGAGHLAMARSAASCLEVLNDRKGLEAEQPEFIDFGHNSIRSALEAGAAVSEIREFPSLEIFLNDAVVREMMEESPSESPSSMN